MPRTSQKPLQLLKGFRDVLPEHQTYWDFFLETATRALDAYGFQKIDVPILEYSSLYVKGTGRHTDIVDKELYQFEDKGGDSVALRPEFTPGICRAYLEHGFVNRPQPVKFYSFGPVFRHDNPQAGRFRQFNQLDLEAIGSDSPVLDAQLIIIAYRFFISLGLSPIVHINSIGCPDCRGEYLNRLKQFLSAGSKKKSLCDSCKERYVKNPLRILDCKEEGCQEILNDAPQIVDFLCEDCKKHFMQVLEYLDDLGIEYNLNVKLVRGLDYYTRTTFEIYAKEEIDGSQSALAGGGRFDGLIEVLGGKPTPAVGLAFGVERIISKMREKSIVVPERKPVDVFVAELGGEARKECFKLFERLLGEGINVRESFSKEGLKQQLEKANLCQAKLTLILGQKELMDRTIIIRDMNSGIQEIVNYDKIVEEVKKRLATLENSVKSYRLSEQEINANQTSIPAPKIDRGSEKKSPKPAIDRSEGNPDFNFEEGEVDMTEVKDDSEAPASEETYEEEL
jgi:histidyl-tRNA synthetase